MTTPAPAPPEFHGRPANVRAGVFAREELLDNAKRFAGAEEFTAYRSTPNRGALWPDERALCGDYVSMAAELSALRAENEKCVATIVDLTKLVVKLQNHMDKGCAP